MNITFDLNGQDVSAEVRAGETLLTMLRRLDMKSVKNGCEEGECGACTVLLDGQPVNACLVFAGAIEGRSVQTVEGIGTQAEPHPIQEAFADAGAVQCGFCTPGMILSTKALLEQQPDPTADEIREALAGNLCRCTGYVKIIDAVQDAAKRLHPPEPEKG